MFEELRRPGEDGAAAGDAGAGGQTTLRQAVTQIVIADVSMSLDNVLAVAGAAQQNWMALIFGLLLSVLLMGVAASLVARLLARFRWIGWLGLAVIVYVALEMIYNGFWALVGTPAAT
jgi:predicted tellurium resistance membrane protein TerC